jgi:pimeloyl-ACP methyl ester carboxylesterase
MRVDRVTSRDGAGITVYSVGSGPGIVILHGGGVTERDYHRLAHAWSDRFTVYLYNRRGRPDSAPLTGTETAATDIDDLSAVLEHTGARNIFGHSGGGFVAMRAGLSLPLDRIAVFDPAVSIDGHLRMIVLDQIEAALRTGDTARALTLAGQQAYAGEPVAKLPFGLRLLITRAFLRTPIGRRFAELLPTLPPELRRIDAHHGPATDYAGITADVLLAYGSRSQRYFGRICESLADAIPGARAVAIPRSAHNAANIARSGFVRPFTTFFSGSLAPA